jgi:hypothetical protein
LRRETAIEQRTHTKALKRYGVPSIKLEPPTGSETGWPDRLFFIPGGRPFLLEFKEVGYTPDPKQEYIHDMLEGLGYDVAWTDNEEAALEAIQARVQQGRARLSEEGD